MMKKTKRVPMKSSPSSTSYPVGEEEARARWKHQSLFQDYNELIKETEAKKMKLQKTIEKKLKLLAEVKFLRRKYKSLSRNPTQETQYRLKKQQSHKIQPPALRITPLVKQVNQSELPLKQQQSHKIQTPAVRITLPAHPVNQSEFPSKKQQHHKIQPRVVRITPSANTVNQSELPLKDSRNRRAKEAGAPSTSRLLDLNQISSPSIEEMQEFQVEWEPLQAGKMKRGPTDEEAAANDLKLSICREVGSNPIRVGKRKISWQDQVALRV